MPNHSSGSEKASTVPAMTGDQKLTLPVLVYANQRQLMGKSQTV